MCSSDLADEAAEVAAEGGMIPNDEIAMEEYANGLRLSVALSVGFAIMLGVLRILKGQIIAVLWLSTVHASHVSAACLPSQKGTLESLAVDSGMGTLYDVQLFIPTRDKTSG